MQSAYRVPRDGHLERAQLLTRDAQAAETRRDLTGALARYQEARVLLTELPPTLLHVNVLRWTGSVLRDLGRIDAADRMYADSLALADETGDTGAKAEAVNCRAVIAQRRGKMDEAERLYREAATLARQAGHSRLVGMVEQNLGVLANIRGDLDAALDHYKVALRAFEQASDLEAASWVLNNMGMLLTDLGLPTRAEIRFKKGLEIARARGDRPMEGILSANCGECMIAMQRWVEAEREIKFALEVAREGQDRGREGEAWRLLGVLELRRWRSDAAQLCLDNAIAIGQSIDDPLLVAEALRERGELHRQRGLFDHAMADWSMAREGFDSIKADADAVEVGVLVAQLRESSPGGEQPADVT
jgi:tetratricopeptide (TPR) repeat protein